tara:strand:+ start:1077 stop:2279 length:1203 start_codon:yes stop_codon:yes gene_type:complete
MKLIIFTQHFWPENFRINDMAEQIIKNKKIKELSVFTAKPNYPKGRILTGYKKFSFEEKKRGKIKIYRTQIIPRGKASTIDLVLNYLSYIISALYNIFKIKKNFDLIFVYATSPIFQAIPAILFSKINKIPIVLWVQDLWPNSVQDTGYIKNKLILIIIRYITRLIYNNCDLILVQSKKFIYPVKKLSNTQIRTFYNPSQFSSVRKKKYKVKKNKIKKIYYTGNIGNAQNLENLIKFCKNTKLNNFKITLFGDGSRKDWIKKIIINESLSKKIEIKNYLKNNFIKEIAKADSLLLMLSKGKALSKTIPAKFQTYLYFGKPIISWSDGEVSNIINKNKLGYTAKSNSIHEFSQSVSKIINMKQKSYKKFYFNNINFFNNNFCIKKNSEELIKIFINLIRKK